VSDELPAGWASLRLGEISIDIQYGYTAASTQDPQGPRLLRITDIQDGKVNWARVPSCVITDRELVKYRLASVYPVFARTGATTGKSFLIRECPPDSVFASYLIRVRPNNEIVGLQLLAHFFQTPAYWDHITASISGIAQPNCNATKLAELIVPLPPLPEQKRIADKLDALLARVDACRERLDRVPKILKRFRQSVLAAATSGELTREWREARETQFPATELLERIAAERVRRGLQSAERAINIEGIEEPNLVLPESWTWCRIGQIADVRLGGTPSRIEGTYWNGDIPWVSSGEVANARITHTAENLSWLGLESSNAKLYPRGTVLIAMIGEGKTRGQSALLEIDATTNQNVAGLVFETDLVEPEYVWYWALGEYDRTRSVGRGGNQPALNGAKVRALPMPLAPPAEQRAIVDRVKVLFDLADEMELRLTAASAIARVLTPSILAKAFRGELVPQDPNDEPASELLARIRSQVAVSGGAKPKRGKA